MKSRKPIFQQVQVEVLRANVPNARGECFTEDCLKNAVSKFMNKAHNSDLKVVDDGRRLIYTTFIPKRDMARKS